MAGTFVVLSFCTRATRLLFKAICGRYGRSTLLSNYSMYDLCLSHLAAERCDKSSSATQGFTPTLFLPLLDFVVCPTGPHPPPRLARRPNQGHTGGEVWTPSCGACLLFFDREKGSALPTLNEVQMLSNEPLSISRNECEKKLASSGLEPMIWF